MKIILQGYNTMNKSNLIQTKLDQSRPDSDIAVKYYSDNPIIRLLMQNFLSNFNFLLKQINPKSILELGSGEGFLSNILASTYSNIPIVSSDVSTLDLQSRKNNLKKYKNVTLEIIDAKKIMYRSNSFDLVVASEVLEHISDPEKAISEIYRVSKKFALLSVPNEPTFHLLNMVRGKYLNTFGNFPEHVNHWSKNSFIHFVKSVGFKVNIIKTPLPWLMVLAEK
jgi:ubiquinone/menaquinone biosynthesis C-methylase UbiE